MKWATPAWASVSRRDPARTYAAMETERAPGIRALMTRGPEASTVRSNIVGMVQEPVCDPATTRHHASVGGGARYPDAVPVVAHRPSRMDATEDVRRTVSMMRRHLSWLAALVTVILLVGACNQAGGSSAPSGGAPASGGPRPNAPAPGPRAVRPTSRSPMSRPASSTSPWSSSARTTTAAGARPTTKGSSTSARTCPTAHVAYIELVPEGADSEQVFRSLARKGFNFIIGTSFGYMDPMATVAEEFPDTTFLHLTGLQVERQELRQLLRRDGGLQVPRRHARGLAGQGRRQPEDRLHGDLPDPGGAAPRQRDHARRQGHLPRVHDGRPLHQHLARPESRSATAPPRCSMRARRSSSPAPTRPPSPTSPRRRASGASPTTIPASCKVEPA